MNNMNENFDVFDDYAMKFDFNEYSIRRKYEHSYRVMRESDAIVYSLGLEEDDSYLASFIGLFHDIGRFEQWTNYKTFNDSKSLDHGNLGSKILFKDNLVSKTNLNKEDYNIVKVAIENHNKLNIDSSLKNKELLHSKIVRDADKIDILYQLSNAKILGIDNDDSKISPKVREDFYNRKCVKYQYMKSVNDKVIAVLSLAYDLNFDYSKKTILERNYFERIFEQIKDKKMFKEYFDETIKYLKEQL